MERAAARFGEAVQQFWDELFGDLDLPKRRMITAQLLALSGLIGFSTMAALMRTEEIQPELSALQDAVYRVLSGESPLPDRDVEAR